MPIKAVQQFMLGTVLNNETQARDTLKKMKDAGYGNTDLLSLMEQAKSVPVEAVILESHRNWVEKSPVKSFQRSAELLEKYV